MVSMAEQLSLHQRITDRRAELQRLVAGFGGYVDRFDANRQFRSHAAAVDALEDDDFFDYMYATLASWGLLRMGPGNAKLVEIDELRGSFQAQRERILALQDLRIENIHDRDVGEVARSVWEILLGLKVGVGEALLVANTKALHNLLPDLVPPIDRNYTLMFFVGRPYIYRGRDGEYFKELFPLFREISMRCLDDIRARIHTPWTGMNTSVTKVIDNAILGYLPAEGTAVP
jgi:hypothetical protein